MAQKPIDEVEIELEFDLSDVKPEAVARMLKQAMKREAMRQLPSGKRKAAAEGEGKDEESDDDDIGEEMGKLADLKEESGAAAPMPVSPEDMAKSTAKKLAGDLAAARDKKAPRKKS
jgi:hypothetical protein